MTMTSTPTSPGTISELQDAVYYGSVPIAFAAVDDAVCSTITGPPRVIQSAAEATSSAIRRDPIAAHRPCEPDVPIRVTVPNVPGGGEVATAVAGADVAVGDSAATSGASAAGGLPRPMIKVPTDPAAPAHVATGVASGVRSALFRSGAGASWFRLKGCGNNAEGFVLERRGRLNSADDADLFEQRGCSYEYLSRLELSMTAEIARCLDPFGIRPANVAVGWWRYPERLAAVRFSDPSLVQQGVVSQPTCTVMATIGDRRLGSHVIAGIDLLLPCLVSEVNVSAIDRLIPPERPREADGTAVPAGHIACDHHIASALGLDTRGTTFMCRLDRSSLVDVAAAATAPAEPLWSEHVDDTTLAPEGLRALLSFAVREGDICAAALDATVATWHPLWDAKAKELQAALIQLSSSSSSSRGLLLADVMYRLGHECGRFLGGLHAHGYSWGTFADASCLPGQLHCNAHSNNFVLADPRCRRVPAADAGAVPPSLLGYLDLDMAFPFKEDGGASKGGGSGGMPDPPQNVFTEEHFGLLEVLLGADSSSGVRGAPAAVTDAYPAGVKAVRSVLYDALALGFLDGEAGWQVPVDLSARRSDVGTADGRRATAELFDTATDALLAMAVIVRHATIA